MSICVALEGTRLVAQTETVESCDQYVLVSASEYSTYFYTEISQQELADAYLYGFMAVFLGYLVGMPIGHIKRAIAKI